MDRLQVTDGLSSFWGWLWRGPLFPELNAGGSDDCLDNDDVTLVRVRLQYSTRPGQSLLVATGSSRLESIQACRLIVGIANSSPPQQ